MNRFALLTAYNVRTAYEMGWSALANGDLLDSAEREAVDAMRSGQLLDLTLP